MFRSSPAISRKRRGQRQRSYLYRPKLQSLEDRRLLAVVAVDTDQDVVDSNDDVTSLREAIAATNAMSGGDEIVFDIGLDEPATILLQHGQLEVTDALTITGPGPDLLTIDAQEQSRILDFRAVDRNFSIEGLRLTRGRTVGEDDPYSNHVLGGGAIRIRTDGMHSIVSSVIEDNAVTGSHADGGGISSNGHLTVVNSKIHHNSAAHSGGGIRGSNVTVVSSMISDNEAGADGGGIRGGGHLTVVRVTSSIISGNSAGGTGGGIYNYDTELNSSTISGNSSRESGGGVAGHRVSVSSSTISGNSAVLNGGGTFAEGTKYATTSINSSTISGNSAGVRGGGIHFKSGFYLGWEGSRLTVTSSTVTGNSAGKFAGGIYANESDGHIISNSIVATNSDSGRAPNVWASEPIPSLQHSLVGDNTGTNWAEASAETPDADGNRIGGPIGGVIDPLIGPLADNGGPTFTHALVAGSPAINSGDPSAVAGVDDVPLYDQRGDGFSRVQNGRIDIGAIEYQFSAADINQDGSVDAADAAILFSNWGTVPPGDPIADLNNDNVVDAADAGILFTDWTADSAQRLVVDAPLVTHEPSSTGRALLLGDQPSSGLESDEAFQAFPTVPTLEHDAEASGRQRVPCKLLRISRIYRPRDLLAKRWLV